MWDLRLEYLFFFHILFFEIVFHVIIRRIIEGNTLPIYCAEFEKEISFRLETILKKDNFIEFLTYCI